MADFLLYIILLIILSINRLSVKYQKIVKNAHHSFREPKVMSSNVLFCWADSPKRKDMYFTVIEDKENHKIFTFEKLEMVNFCHFCLKNDSNN